jgi:IS5 family transposase
MFNMSDENVVKQWRENWYWRAFTLQEKDVDITPCCPSQMAQFRKRIGEEGCEFLFQESRRIHGPEALEDSCIADTTVQEKNVTFPTDTKLMMKAIDCILKIGTFLLINFRCKFVKEIKAIKSAINFSKSKLNYPYVYGLLWSFFME